MKPSTLRAGVAFLIIWIIAVGCASQKTGQIPVNIQDKCDAPKWNVGDTWIYQDYSSPWRKTEVIHSTVLETEGDSYTVQERDPWGTVVVKVKKDDLQMKWFMTEKGAGGYARSEYPYHFPLYVGKSWHHWYGPILYELKVVSVENVTTPAGTFKAFKIESRVGTGYHNKWYHWYSPDVKRFVAIHRHYYIRTELNVETEIELVSYSITPE
jgi:hypothetical protein